MVKAWSDPGFSLSQGIGERPIPVSEYCLLEVAQLIRILLRITGQNGVVYFY